MILADLGAEVIKIEAPNRGDYLRWMPPHPNSSQMDKGAAFMSLNRGKSSLSVNLKSDEGKVIFHKLVAQSDIIVESFRPGVMDRLGLGPTTLCENNERLIYCAISGYGQTGTYRDRAGHDLNYLAASGVLHQNGAGPFNPTIPGFQLADIAGGSLYAVISILAAIVSRGNNGKGARLDISMTEGAATFLTPLFSRIMSGETLPLTGKDQLTGGLPCYQIYRTKDDKFVTLAALEPHFWDEFCRVVNRPDWSPLGHLDNPNTHLEVSALFASHPLSHWRQLGKDHDICLEPILSPEEAMYSTLSLTREWFLSRDVDKKSGHLQTATPVTPRDNDAPFKEAPSLGEDTRQILLALNYSEEEIEALSIKGHIKIKPS
jgi:crotonobetainyl-CoA:carnitine CoA-transferase CaiB-like acyl-CoA transferase